MNIFHRIALGCACLAVVTPALASEVHKECADCHEGKKKLRVKKVNDLCMECHPANVNDHKLDVKMDYLPYGLPLDRNMEITCVTCHDPHGRTSEPNLLRTNQTSLCIACHPK